MSEWRKYRLEEVVRLKRGFDLATPNRKPGPFPVVGSAGISGWHNEGPIGGPAVVLGRAGASMGVASYCDVERFWPLNTALFVENFMGNDPRFIFYLFKVLDLTGFNSGSVQPMLNRNYIRNVPVRIPGLPEQEMIVEVLGALDDKMVVNDRIAHACEDLALARGSEALGKAVGGTASMSDYVEVTKGVSYRSAELVGNDGVLISLKCVSRGGRFQPDGAKPYSGEFKPDQVLSEGDIVVALTDLTQRAEVIGKPARVVNLGDWNLMVASLDLAIVRPKNGLTGEIIHTLLSTPDFHDHAVSHSNGTTVLHMSARALPTFRFQKPSDEIISRTTVTMRPLFSRSDQARRENHSLAELRDTLLPRLMSGEIRVRDAERIVEGAT
jgi:type I restriction enzyme S subunit